MVAVYGGFGESLSNNNIDGTWNWEEQAPCWLSLIYLRGGAAGKAVNLRSRSSELWIRGDSHWPRRISVFFINLCIKLRAGAADQPWKCLERAI